MLPLVDAVVTPDEDGHGFTITASNGFIFKLKAADARSRQIWIDQLRCAAKGVQKALPPEYISQVANNQADNYATKNVEHLHAAKESLAAARKYLAEIEDECDKLPMNETYLKLRAYGRAAIQSLERATDIAERNIFFGRSELRKTPIPSEKTKDDVSDESDVEESVSPWLAKKIEFEEPMTEYSDEQRDNMVSIMQAIPLGENLLSGSWPAWSISRNSGAFQVAYLCRHCPSSTDPSDLAKWLLSVNCPSSIFRNRIPAKSPQYYECKFGEKHLQIESFPGPLFKVSIANGLLIKFTLSFQSNFQGPGRPFYIQPLMTDLNIGIHFWNVIEMPSVRIQHPLSTPSLSWSGKWELHNRELDQKITLNYLSEDRIEGSVVDRESTSEVTLSGTVNEPLFDGSSFKPIEADFFLQLQ